MTALPITTILTALAVFALIALSLPVSLRRRKTAIAAGDGGDEALRRLIRAHGNFVEYVPMILIAIGLAEAGGAEPAVLWTLGALAGVGRLLHALGMLSDSLPPKAIGMVLTLLALLGAGLTLASLALA
ncbi:MAG TPA: MAPEG family protein [Caulobacteraceae bacterium]|nr:MAPEG family protein [Caulobacteraceae bacterium]